MSNDQETVAGHRARAQVAAGPKARAAGWRRAGSVLLLSALLMLLSGCMDPGPRALLKGERLLRNGKYEQAIEQLQMATRLLPKNAQAHNHLGLAYHYSKQPEPAQRCYRQALALDQNLAVARYNLGCLFLEQNDPQAAIDPLTSYTFLQPKEVAGWLKLGTAQLRARRLDDAERSFRSALALRPRDPEALNGLGNVQFYRRRMQEALTSFTQALAQNPQYPPALVNAAVVAHQSLNNRPQALRLYQKYLALQPHPAQHEAVAAIANQLDLELNPPLRLVPVNPPTPAPAPAPAPAPLVPKTNVVLALTPTSAPAPVRPAPAPARPPVVALVPSNPPRVAVNVPTNPPKVVAHPPPAVAQPPPAPTTNKSPVTAPAKPPPAAADVQVTRLPDDLVVKPPQDLASADHMPAVGPTTSVPAPATVVEADPKTGKRGWLTRLNPFGGKPKPATNVTAVTPVPELARAGKLPETNSLPAPGPAAAAVSVPRYTYAPPVPLVPGNRAEAEHYFTQAIKAQRAGRLSQALAEYQRAVQTDPSYFEAYYNQGLAAYELRNWGQSLRAYEFALALKPDSADARYNFALALKQANYPQDAANELLTLLKAQPNEPRAHLSLGNLYARQLEQPAKAREHYLKLLELDPHHPQASEIRYWLAAH